MSDDRPDLVGHLEAEHSRLEGLLVSLVDQIAATGELLAEAVACSARLRRAVEPHHLLDAAGVDEVERARLKGLLLRATAFRWQAEPAEPDNDVKGTR